MNAGICRVRFARRMMFGVLCVLAVASSAAAQQGVYVSATLDDSSADACCLNRGVVSIVDPAANHVIGSFDVWRGVPRGVYAFRSLFIDPSGHRSVRSAGRQHLRVAEAPTDFARSRVRHQHIYESPGRIVAQDRRRLRVRRKRHSPVLRHGRTRGGVRSSHAGWVDSNPRGRELPCGIAVWRPALPRPAGWIRHRLRQRDVRPVGDGPVALCTRSAGRHARWIAHLRGAARGRSPPLRPPPTR